MDNQAKRHIEYRFVIDTEMSDKENDLFLDELEVEIMDHLLPGEDVVSSLWSNSISYENQKQLQEKKNNG